MKVLVTGAAGRLGSCVCRLLLEQGIEFVAVDRVSDVAADYEVLVTDLLRLQDAKSLLQGIDVLVHFANHANFNTSSPEQVYTENGNKSKRVIY